MKSIIKQLYTILLVTVACLTVAGCSDDFKSNLRLDGDVWVNSIKLDEYAGTIDYQNKTIVVGVPYDYDVTRMAVSEINLSEGATASIAVGETIDFSLPVSLTVKNGDVQMSYTITVKRDEAKILTFKLNDTYVGKVDQLSKTISVVTREEGSGTRDAFTELTGVLVKDGDNKTDNTTTSAVTINSTEAVITNVKDNEAAIGYISLGSLNDTVKALKIGGVEATADNVKSGDYAVSRPFNIAYKGELSDVAQDFVDYIMSSDGQKIVSDNGYVTVSENAAYSGKKPSGKISVAGSSSVSPVMEKLAEAYQKVNTNAKVEIQTSDSSAGMQSAMGGTCDIGMASRDLKDEEKSALKVETIAKDGIAVIVNNANTCDDLTLDQVKSIYTGETTVWSDIIK